MITCIKNYLSVTKKEWNGLVILIVLIAVVLAAPYVDQKLSKDTIINAKAVAAAAAILERHAYRPSFKTPASIARSPGRAFYPKKARLSIPLELNSADSATLTTVYGIGPSFARRIVRYRDRLGGFYNKTQLKEVYGLDAGKYDEINGQVTINTKRLHKVDINTAGFDDLKRFPYLSFKQMNAIIQYRVQHGNYTSAADMQDIAILDKQTINKIKPYLNFK